MNLTHPPPFAWLVSLVVSLATVGLGMVVIFHVAGSQVKAERTAREHAEQVAAQQAELGRKAICVLINTQISVYRDSPPTTDTGKSVAAAWHDLGVLFRCDVN